MTPPPSSPLRVLDDGAEFQFAFADLLRYAGPGSPAGVAVAFQAMRVVFSLLDPDQPLARREIEIDTAFRGPGARDGFELVTRAVTEGRYLVTEALERPERGTALAQFVFRFRYRDRARTLVVRDGLVPDEFIALARTPDRSPADEERFTEMKRVQADLLLALAPEAVFDVG